MKYFNFSSRNHDCILEQHMLRKTPVTAKVETQKAVGYEVSSLKIHKDQSSGLLPPLLGGFPSTMSPLAASFTCRGIENGSPPFPSLPPKRKGHPQSDCLTTLSEGFLV